MEWTWKIFLGEQNKMKTLRNLALAGITALGLAGCTQPMTYPAFYQDVDRDGKLDEISLQMCGFYNWEKGEHKSLQLGDRTYHVDYVFYVAHGNGDGSFGPKIEVHRDHNSGGNAAISEFSVRDFDGDGKADLSYVIFGNRRMFAKGKGDGTFETPRRVQ